MDSPLLQRFSTDNESLPPNRKISWKKFMITNRLDACLNTSGVLQHYIRPQSQSTSNGTDILFKSQDLTTQSKVYAWRANTAFRNKICICTGAFNRRHARDCLPIHQLPQLFKKLMNNTGHAQYLLKFSKNLILKMQERFLLYLCGLLS